jgi:hypothetical protein
MDKSTGSPPDFFDPNGQNWGFPTYNWEAMADEGYAWWAAAAAALSDVQHHVLAWCIVSWRMRVTHGEVLLLHCYLVLGAAACDVPVVG